MELSLQASSRNKTWWRWAPLGMVAVGLAVLTGVLDFLGVTGDV
jgi:hypothetical protein